MSLEAYNLLSHQIENSLTKRLLQACIRERLLPYTLKGSVLLIPLTRSKKTIMIEKVRCFELEKFKLSGEVVLIQQEKSTIIKNVSYLLTLIYHELKETIEETEWRKFVSEINNCIVNDTLATQYIRNLNNDLAADINRANYKNFLDYIRQHYSIGQQLMFFERWAAKGHPYHPCHKTKLGFNKKAYLKFSPEFNADIDLPIAAIAKEISHLESEANGFEYEKWFAAQFPKQWQAWLTEIQSLKLNTCDYYPIFIHPWQYENVLKNLFLDKIEKQQLIIFNHISVKTKASLSFRTLITQEHSTQPHIKLPVAVHSTSAMRTISPASVQNGPKLGHILRNILSRENYFENVIQLALEICGLHVTQYPSDIAKHLGIIFRENPANFVKTNQIPIVVAALFEDVPGKKLPLFIEMMSSANATSLKESIEYFDHYSQIVIKAFLDLFLIYGIALEGHQQNTIAVFENNRLSYMIARDLGGLRIHMPTLKQHGFEFIPYPDSATTTDNPMEVTNKFLHTVIQYHLGEIVLLLAEYYDEPEVIFWQIIKKNIVARFHLLRDRVDPMRWQQEYHAVLEADWQLKGLMRMRLNNLYNKYIYINLKNPLRDA